MNKANIAGWLITICISVFGAYQAMNARVFEVEAKIRLLELEQSNMKAEVKEYKSNMDEIKESLLRIEGKLDQKQDKRYLP